MSFKVMENYLHSRALVLHVCVLRMLCIPEVFLYTTMCDCILLIPLFRPSFILVYTFIPQSSTTTLRLI